MALRMSSGCTQWPAVAMCPSPDTITPEHVPVTATVPIWRPVPRSRTTASLRVST